MNSCRSCCLHSVFFVVCPVSGTRTWGAFFFSSLPMEARNYRGQILSWESYLDLVNRCGKVSTASELFVKRMLLLQEL